MADLIRTAEFVVYQEGPVVTLKQRATVLFGFAVGSGVLAGISWASAEYLLAPEAANGMMSRFFAAVMGVLSLLCGLRALLTALRQPIRVDGNQRALYLMGVPIPFDRVQAFRAGELKLGSSVWARLVAVVDNKEIALGPAIPTSGLPALKKIEQVLSEMLGSPTAPALLAPPESSAPSTGKLAGMILICVGALWAPLGFWFARDVIFTPPNSNHGLLVWPAGIWMAATGALTWAGIWAPAQFEEKKLPRKNVLIGVLLLGSYLLICHR